MHSRRIFLQTSAAAAAYLASGVWTARAENGPGITDTEIKFGQTMPYSGPASAYGVVGRAEAAYFKAINDAGGINGRKISLIKIAGALFKPAGAWPFPTVLFISGWGGINSPANRAQQKAAIDHLLSEGVATLIVDPFTPRNEPQGVCANLGALDEKTAIQYFSRGSNDVLAAVNVLAAMPDIDMNHIFLQGYSYGAISSLSATDAKNSANHANVAGVVAYYPFRYDGVDPSVPVLVMVGEKDDWTPAARATMSHSRRERKSGGGA